MNGSIIKEDGSIVIQISANKVNWQKILQSARITNWKNGGWNSKSYWISHGLEAISAIHDDILMRWTENSLVDGSKRVRTDKYMFRHENLDEGKERGTVGSENRINWNLSKYIWEKTGKNKADTKVTFELPLTDEKENQLKADIVIFHKQKKATVDILEIKKSNNNSDSPLLAVIEGLCYALQIICCWENLIKERELVGLKELSDINIIVAAPEGYWDYWYKSPADNEEKEKIFKKLSKMIESINLQINNEIEVFQKKKKYLPKPKIFLAFANIRDESNREYGKNGIVLREESLKPESTTIFAIDEISVQNPIAEGMLRK